MLRKADNKIPPETRLAVCNYFCVSKKKSKYVAQTVTVSDKIGTRYKIFISFSPYIHGYMRKQNAVIILKFDYRYITKVCIHAFLSLKNSICFECK